MRCQRAHTTSSHLGELGERRRAEAPFSAEEPHIGILDDRLVFFSRGVNEAPRAARPPVGVVAAHRFERRADLVRAHAAFGESHGSGIFPSQFSVAHARPEAACRHSPQSYVQGARRRQFGVSSSSSQRTAVIAPHSRGAQERSAFRSDRAVLAFAVEESTKPHSGDPRERHGKRWCVRGEFFPGSVASGLRLPTDRRRALTLT